LPVALIGWEVGGGLGPIVRSLNIARALARDGWTPVVALRDIFGASTLLQPGEALELVRAPNLAPVWQMLPEGEPRTADLLLINGYDRSETVTDLCGEWMRLIDEYRPALIVDNHAPSLALAARGRIPIIRTGIGRHIPPIGAYERDDLIPDAAEQVLHSAQAAARTLGHVVPQTYEELFAGDETSVLVLPIFDPYADRRDRPAAGPNEPLPPPAPRPKGGIFCYLAAGHGRVNDLLTALALTGLPVEIFLRGATGAQLAWLRERGFLVHETPPPLVARMTRAALLVSYGTAGSATLAMALGRPQVHLPMPLSREQSYDAMQIEACGVGWNIAGCADAQAMADRIVAAAHDRALAANAAAFAAQLAAGPPLPGVNEIRRLAATLCGLASGVD